MHAGKPDLYSIVYHSAATPGFSTIDLDELLSESRTKNRADGVTGMLLAENGRFLQALEGAEPVVRDLMDRIARDGRHEHVRVLVEEPIRARRFPDWAMAHGHLGELETTPLAAYTETLVAARDELPAPPTRAERVAAWFRGSTDRDR